MPSRIRLADRECPLSTALGHVGEWWTLLILHDVFDGYRRFDEFQANLKISSSMLTSRLRTLVEQGLLERRPYQDRPVRYEYVLTDLGRSLRPVLVALAAWGNSRLDPEERSMILVEAATGAEVDPVLVDRVSGRRIDGEGFVFTAGPAASRAFRERYRGGAGPGVIPECPEAPPHPHPSRRPAHGTAGCRARSGCSSSRCSGCSSAF